MRTLAIANHKGGVGKTALAFNLGGILADRGNRVLLIDADPQGTLTGIYGMDAAGKSLADVLGNTTPGTLTLPDVIQHTGENLAFVPSDIELSLSVMGLVLRMGRENILKQALAHVSGADLVIIDCPPSLDLLTINALVAADAVLIPTRPEVPDLRGVQLFLDSVKRIQEELNPRLQILGIVPTFLNPRLLHHKAALDGVQRAGLPMLADLGIGQTVRVAESIAVGRPLHAYEPENPQVENFRRLAEWLEQWLKSGKPTKR